MIKRTHTRRGIAADPTNPVPSLGGNLCCTGPPSWPVLSTSAKDTDLTVKLIDVYPDGTAYNLDETIQRVRYRDGYDKPPVWMEPGKVYSRRRIWFATSSG